MAFLDDHSRFVVCYGLHASQSASLVLEVLEVGLANYGPPEEILTDNGSQYVTWRGKSRFSRRLEQRGIRQLVSRPQRPQTLGKIELTSPGNGSSGNSSPDRSSPTTAGVSGDGPSPMPLLAEPLPAPVCPDGSPRPGAGEPACAAALAPGRTGLDLERVAQATDGACGELRDDARPPADSVPPGGAA